MTWSLLVGCVLLLQAEAAENGAAKNDAAKKAAAEKDAYRQELAREVRQLVRRLVAGEKQQRDLAEKKLVELGPDVLDLLPRLTDETPAETKQRIRRVIEILQKQVADAAGRATLVTLKGEMPLSQALAAMQTQTGNTIIDYRQNFNQEASDPMVKLSLEKVPFWQALDGLMDQANLTLYGYPDEPGVALVNRDEGAAPHSGRPLGYAGPMRTEAVDVLAKRNLRNPSTNLLQLQLDVFWEPRLSPINLQIPLAGLKAVDESGQPLPVKGQGVRAAEVTPGTFSSEMILPFELPQRGVKKLASLKGKLTALVPGKVETYRFSNLLKPRQQLGSAGVKVVMDRMRKNNDVWEVRVILRFEEAGDALSSHRGWVFGNKTWLEDAAGKQISYNGFESIRQTANEVGVAYYYDLEKGPEGMTLVYKTPSVIMNLPVEFELKNVDLP